MRLFDPMPIWFAAEGNQNGMPLLIRGRQIASADIGRPDIPCLFLLLYRYEPEDETGLPNATQYRQLKKFEGRVVDALEKSGAGIAAYIATCNGVVEYFFYVKDIVEAGDFLNQQICEDDPIEMLAKNDPEWSQYSAFGQSIDGLDE